MQNGLVDLSDIVLRPAVADVVLADRPVWLWDVEAGRILFANAAGVAFFGETRLSDLMGRSFDMRRPGLAELERMGRSLPGDGSVRLAMLRFTVGPRQVAVPCACSLLPLGDGRAPVLVAATAGAPDRRPLEDRAAVLFDDLELPVVVEVDGETVYRNPAAEGVSLAGGATVDAAWHDGRVQLVVGAGSAGEETTMADEAEPPEERRSRFTFALDVEGRFIEVGPALSAAVGGRGGAVEGRAWVDVAGDMGLDPEGRLAEAIDRRETWDDVVVWPADEGGTAEVRLAARPRFDDGGIFTGYHGIGDILSVTEGAKALPKLPEDDSVHPLHPPKRQPDGGLSDQERDAFAAIASALGATGGVEAPARTDVPTPSQAPPASPFQTVVSSFMAPPPSTAPEPPRAEAAPAELPVEPEYASPPWPAEADAASGAEPRDHTRAIVTGLLERLPIGVAILRNEAILYANRAFLEVFDYTDLDDLEIAGGMTALFEGRRGDGDTVAARRRDGAIITVESTLGRTDWIDGPAMFVTARAVTPPASGPGDGPRPEPGPRPFESHPAEAWQDEGAGPVEDPADPGLRPESPPSEARQIAELRSVLDTAADGVLVLASDGTIETANRSAEALFGLDREDIVGSPFVDLVADESRVAVADYLDGLTAGGVMSVLNDGREIVARAHRGGDVPLFLTMGRIGDGDPPRFCAVIRDLTEWKAAEAELVAARKHAEEASAQKSDFLAKMSHEIRTPLNAIIGFAEVILEERLGPIGNERYRDYVRDIRESGTHIMSLVNDLLDLSKIEAGKLELNLAGVNLNDVVEQAVAIMQPEAGRQRVIMRTSLARNVPPVVADQRSLRQVMLNLLSNAVNYTPAGGQVIVSTLIGDDGVVHMRVRDTGVGMSEADIQAALEPFRQLPVRGQEPVRGTGLGLPLTRALVEANRAAFVISSRPNEGTLVEVSFPQSRVLAE